MQKKQLNNIIQKITELSKEDKAAFLDYMLSTATNDTLIAINDRVTNNTNEITNMNVWLTSKTRDYAPYINSILTKSQYNTNILYIWQYYNSHLIASFANNENNSTVPRSFEFNNKNKQTSSGILEFMLYVNSIIGYSLVFNNLTKYYTEGSLKEVDTKNVGTYYVKIVYTVQYNQINPIGIITIKKLIQ